MTHPATYFLLQGVEFPPGGANPLGPTGRDDLLAELKEAIAHRKRLVSDKHTSSSGCEICGDAYHESRCPLCVIAAVRVRDELNAAWETLSGETKKPGRTRRKQAKKQTEQSSTVDDEEWNAKRADHSKQLAEVRASDPLRDYAQIQKQCSHGWSTFIASSYYGGTDELLFICMSCGAEHRHVMVRSEAAILPEIIGISSVTVQRRVKTKHTPCDVRAVAEAFILTEEGQELLSATRAIRKVPLVERRVGTSAEGATSVRVSSEPECSFRFRAAQRAAESKAVELGLDPYHWVDVSFNLSMRIL